MISPCPIWGNPAIPICHNEPLEQWARLCNWQSPLIYHCPALGTCYPNLLRWPTTAMSWAVQMGWFWHSRSSTVDMFTNTRFAGGGSAILACLVQAEMVWDTQFRRRHWKLGVGPICCRAYFAPTRSPLCDCAVVVVVDVLLTIRSQFDSYVICAYNNLCWH